MKTNHSTFIAAIIFCCLFFVAQSAQAQIINIPDANFKNALVNTNCVTTNVNGTTYSDADLNNDGEIQVSEAEAVVGLEIFNRDIISLVGIEYFSNLRTLDCGYNKITTLNIQGLNNLQTLNCRHNKITTLNIQGLNNLQILDCSYNELTALNVQGLNNLQTLDCSYNNLTALNVQGLDNLKGLYCNSNQLTTLNVQGLNNLQTLDCSYNNLTALNVQGLDNLKGLYCYNNQLTTLNIQGLNNLKGLYCYSNQLMTLNVQGLDKLTELTCYYNRLTALNVQGLNNLQGLACGNNQITILDIQGLNNLISISCHNNQLMELNVQGLNNLQTIQCSYNQITTLNVLGLNNLAVFDCHNNQITTLNVQGLDKLEILDCSYNPISCLSWLSNSLFELNVNNTNINCLTNKPLNVGIFPFIPLCQPNNINGCFSAARIYGAVLRAESCVPTGKKMANLLVTAKNIATNEIYVSNSDTAGMYEIAVPLGTYTVAVTAPNAYWADCVNPQTIVITQDAQQELRNVLVNAEILCTDMSIDHQALTVMRPCSTGVFQVHYLNQGTITAEGIYVEMELAPELSVVSASVPFSSLGSQLFRFELDSVQSLQSGDFQVSVSVACTAVLGQQLCTRAEIFPHSYCNGGSSGGSWDGSDVAVSGRCVGQNQVRFVLKNIGNSPMSVPQNYWIVEDDVMIRGDIFQLAMNASDSITITADPRKIYRIIANETPFNPENNTQETFLIWGCSGLNGIHWGFVNQYGFNTGRDFEDFLCTTVRTSFDPNDISAVGAGTRAEHFIAKKSELEYTIRFQNTGNDTAFVVRITDMLPPELDKTTLQIGASSHPMTYNLKGNGVLEFLFTNILLPDSTTNEKASHGFVSYKINTKPNLQDGQTIDNQANIYFDVNLPVATNTYRHTIAKDMTSVFLGIFPIESDFNTKLNVMPNPMRDAATFELVTEKVISAQHPATLIVYNILGQKVHTQLFTGTTLTLSRGELQQGCYFYSVQINNQILTKGKLVVD